MAAQRLPAALTGAEEVSVAFNPAYLPDALSSFGATRLRVQLLGTGQRTLLSSADAPQSHRHLLTSVRQLVWAATATAAASSGGKGPCRAFHLRVRRLDRPLSVGCGSFRSAGRDDA